MRSMHCCRDAVVRGRGRRRQPDQAVACEREQEAAACAAAGRRGRLRCGPSFSLVHAHLLPAVTRALAHHLYPLPPEWRAGSSAAQTPARKLLAWEAHVPPRSSMAQQPTSMSPRGFLTVFVPVPPVPAQPTRCGSASTSCGRWCCIWPRPCGPRLAFCRACPRARLSGLAL